jgi:hypothetical protein
MKTDNKTVQIGPYTFSERELAQQIRRKMITKESKNLKKYNRKVFKKIALEHD